MSDFENPYQSPETQIVPEAKQSTGVELTVTMLNYLNQASPWLRFVGVMGYIGAAFMVVMGIVASVGMASALNLLGDELPAAFGAVFAIYIPIGVVMFFPAHFTFMFGQKIRSYRFTNSTEDLEVALKNNKSFWKFIGICYIVYLAFIPVVIILGIIIGVAGVLGAF